MSHLSKPRLIVVSGPNGSGKTSITEKLLRHQWMQNCEYINPDYIARDLYGDWNSQEAIIRAANKSEEIRENCLKEEKNIAFETVLSAPDKIDFMLRAKEAGYFIRVFFVATNHPSINAARVAQRVMEGGHDVPISKIISRYKKSIANAIATVSFADRVYIYDNSIENEDPSLLFRCKNGQLFKEYQSLESHPWAEMIKAAI